MLGMSTILLSLLLGAGSPAPYSCGPFLLAPERHAITIVVDHRGQVAAELRGGIVGHPQSIRLVHNEARRHHIFEVKGLTAGTEYWYEISSGEELASGRHRFRTLPQAPPHYKLIVLGDVRTLPQRWHAVSQRVFEKEKDALFVIGTGDYPIDGRNYDLWIRQFFKPARDLLGAKALWPAIGNHELTRRAGDLNGPERSHFFSLFELPGNERWYRSDYQLHTLIILDSNSHMRPGSPQYAWLRRQLRSSRKRFTLVAFHHAPYTSGPHAFSFPDGTPREWPVDEARRFLSPLFEIYGVDLVINGHDHLYERSLKGGVPYVVSGGGGAPLYKVNSVPNPYQVVAKAAHHYLRLELDEEAIAMTAIDIGGKTIDRARFPVRKSTLTRRKLLLKEKIKSSFRFTRSNSHHDRLRLAVTNPLDSTLKITSWLSGESEDSTRKALEIAPGETKLVEFRSQSLAAAPTPKPWDPPVRVAMGTALRGRDGAMDIAFQWAQSMRVGRPRYELIALPGFQLGGPIAQWTKVPAIEIGKRITPLRGQKVYGGEVDLSASIRMARTRDALLFRAEVRDDDVQNGSRRSLMSTDSVHLIFASERGPWEEAQKLSCAAGGRMIWQLFPLSQAKRITARTEHGYQIEAVIPLALFDRGLPPQFFDILIVDRDAGQAESSFHRLYTHNLRSIGTEDFGRLSWGTQGEAKD